MQSLDVKKAGTTPGQQTFQRSRPRKSRPAEENAPSLPTIRDEIADQG